MRDGIGEVTVLCQTQKYRALKDAVYFFGRNSCSGQLRVARRGLRPNSFPAHAHYSLAKRDYTVMEAAVEFDLRADRPHWSP